MRWLLCLLWRLPAVLRQRSLGPVDEAFGADFVFQSVGKRIAIRGGSFGLVREIFGQHCYAKPAELQSMRTIIDLGANCGTFSLFARLNAPHAQIRSVEAVPEFAARARANLEHNGLLDQADVQNAIVGCASNAWTRELESAHGAIKRLDGFGIIAGLGDIDFLKCDIEGAEYDLFSGDLGWTRSISRMAIEYHGDWADGQRLGRALATIGYRVEQLPHGSLGYLTCSRNQ